MDINELLVKAGVPVAVITFFTVLLVFPEKLKSLFRVGGKSERETLSDDEAGFRKHLLERVVSLEDSIKVATTDRADLHAKLMVCTEGHEECEEKRIKLERRLDAFIIAEGANAIDKVLTIGTIAPAPDTAQKLLADRSAEIKP